MSDEEQADEWWNTLSAERKVQVHRWIAQGAGPPRVEDPLQTTIEDALEETR